MPTQFDRAIFSERLKRIRLSRGYKTQTEFANEIGISGQAVSYYESGQRLPDAGTLYLLADFFECSIDWLLGISDNMYPDNKYIEEVTGLNDDAIEYLSEGHFSIDPSKRLILNMLLSDFYIDNLVDSIQETAENIIKKACSNLPEDITILRREKDLQELEKTGEVDTEFIERKKMLISLEKELDKHIFEDKKEENIDLCKFRFLRSMEYLLEHTAVALSARYGEWLIGKKLEEIDTLRFMSTGAANGINKA